MLQGILFVTALCLDSLLASLAYASQKIRIPLKSAFVTAMISTLFLGLSFLLSAPLSSLLPAWAASLCSGLVFAAMSVYCAFQGAIKRLLSKKKRGIRLHYGSVQIVLDVYLDEKKADRDHSKTLSVKEACYLAITLSLDSLFSGLAMGFSLAHPLKIAALNFLAALLAIYLPARLADRLLRKSSYDLNWLSALLFAVLAWMRLG